MKNALATIVVSSMLVLSGCGTQSDEADPQAFPPVEEPQAIPEPAPAPPAASNELSTTGELADVNPEAGTFSLVSADGASQTFQFGDSTTILGGEGAQGLATQEGNQITVYYNFDTDPPTATRVEVGEQDQDLTDPAGL